MKKRQFTALVFVLLLVVSGCDFERYTGYKVEGQDLIDYTTINGRLTNVFTDEPVYGAHVIIDGLETYSGSNGDFNFIYPLTADVDRNRPAEITIHVENYFPFRTQKQLYPDFNTFYFSLTYAAPVILNAAKVADFKQFPFYYCQAIIRDYQGLGNIKQVTGVFPLTGRYEGDRTLRQRMTLLEVDPLNPNTGYFQCQLPFDAPYEDYFFIEALDNDGYTDRFQHAVDSNDPDDFIFSPF